MRDWKIIQKKDGRAYVKMGYKRRFLWFSWVYYPHECWLRDWPNGLELVSSIIRRSFSSIDSAKCAIKLYLDSIETEKIYHVDIKEVTNANTP